MSGVVTMSRISRARPAAAGLALALGTGSSARPAGAQAHRMRMAPAPGDSAPTIAVLVYDGMTALDAVGPIQMLGMLRMRGWRVVTVAKRPGPVHADNGLVLEAERGIAAVPRADVLVIPGGLEGSYRLARDTAVTHWVARVHATTRATASVCTGAWVLAAAGVLAPGDTAATHWLGRDELERAGVVYTADRVHRAGKVWTAAGVSAGLDLGLAMVEAFGGRELAEHTQLVAQYDPKPPLDAGSPEKAPAQAAAMRRMHAERMRELAATAKRDAARTTGIGGREMP